MESKNNSGCLIIIVHGTGNDPNGNWFPWLASELRKLGHKVLVPHFPTPEGQSLAAWLKVFDTEVGFELPASSILIGHSIGPALLLRVLERLSKPIQTSIFVSAWLGLLGLAEFDPLIETFFQEPFEWKKINANSKSFICMHGENDPYVPLKRGVELAKKLHTKLITIKDGGHLNADSGYLTFPLLLEKVTQQISGGRCNVIKPFSA